MKNWTKVMIIGLVLSMTALFSVAASGSKEDSGKSSKKEITIGISVI